MIFVVTVSADACQGLKTSSEFLPTVLKTPKALTDKLLTSRTVVSLIEWRWGVLKPLWMTEFALFLVFLGSYVAWMCNQMQLTVNNGGEDEGEGEDEDEDNGDTGWATIFLAALTLIMLVPFLIIEYLQALPRAKILLDNQGSWTISQLPDCITYMLVITSVIWGSLDPGGVHELLISITTALMFYRAANFLRALKSFGFLVSFEAPTAAHSPQSF